MWIIGETRKAGTGRRGQEELEQQQETELKTYPITDVLFFH